MLTIYSNKLCMFPFNESVYFRGRYKRRNKEYSKIAYKTKCMVSCIKLVTVAHVVMKRCKCFFIIFHVIFSVMVSPTTTSQPNCLHWHLKHCLCTNQVYMWFLNDYPS